MSLLGPTPDLKPAPGLPTARNILGIGLLVVPLMELTFGRDPDEHVLLEAFQFHLANAAEDPSDCIVLATVRPANLSTLTETALDLAASRLTAAAIELLERVARSGFTIPAPQRQRLAAMADGGPGPRD